MEVLFSKQSGVAFKGIAPSLRRPIERSLVKTGEDFFALNPRAEALIKNILGQAGQNPIDITARVIFQTTHALVKRTNQAISVIAKKTQNKGLLSWLEGVTDRKIVAAFLRNIKDEITDHANALRAEVHRGFNYTLDPLSYINTRTQWHRKNLAQMLSRAGFGVDGVAYDPSKSNYKIATFKLTTSKKPGEQYNLLLFREPLRNNETPQSLLAKWEVPGKVCLSDSENGFALVSRTTV